MSERLLEHVGHNVVIVTYAGENVALECEDCYEVIMDFDYQGKETK
jgi:hypothetical protein